MKRGHQQPFPYPPQIPKKKKKGTFIVVLIIAAVIFYFYFSSTGSFNLNFLNLGNFSLGNQNATSSNPDIQKCIQSASQCGSVIKSKYDATVTIIQSAETNSTDEANNFLKTWGTSSQSSDINSYNAGSPAVLVATRFNNPDGSKTPHVFVCKVDGSLTDASTTGLC